MEKLLLPLPLKGDLKWCMAWGFRLKGSFVSAQAGRGPGQDSAIKVSASGPLSGGPHELELMGLGFALNPKP